MPALALVLAAHGVTSAQGIGSDGDDALARRVEQMATHAARATLGGRADARVEVTVGQLDPRLKLAPCRRVEAYLPPGQRAWGRTRVGLRCAEGEKAWNVSLPLTVKVFAPALVVTQALGAGTELQAAHLLTADVEWTAADSPVVAVPALATGRALARPLAAGAPLREADLKKRQWFAAGEPVRLVARGPGFAVSGDGMALGHGWDGQTVRVRTEAGRTVTGVATAKGRVEVAL
jgi:flagella basal body P-ring formation protein FlgA